MRAHQSNEKQESGDDSREEIDGVVALRTPQRSRDNLTLSSWFCGEPPPRLFLRGNHLRFLVSHCSGGHASTALYPRRGACLAVRLQSHLLGLLRAASQGPEVSISP